MRHDDDDDDLLVWYINCCNFVIVKEGMSLFCRAQTFPDLIQPSSSKLWILSPGAEGDR